MQGVEPNRAGIAPCPEWALRGRIPCLDGLRGLAILGVLICHGALTHGSPVPASAGFITAQMGLGVDVFFVISGFLITLLLLREWNRDKRVSLKQFYLRRVLRIVPAYLAYLLALLVLQPFVGFHLSGRDWFTALTYTVSLVREPSWYTHHAWSLSVEEHFYFVWPLLLCLAGPRLGRFLLIGFLAAVPAIRYGTWLFLRQHLDIDYFTLARFDGIAMGCLLGFLAVDPALGNLRAAVQKRLGWLAAAALAVLLVSTFVLMRSGKYTILFSTLVSSFSIAILVWACVNSRDRWIGRILEWKPLVGLGLLSYSLYLWQQLFLYTKSDHWTARFPLNFVLTFAAAALSYYLVETPFLRMKARLSAETARAPEGTEPAGLPLAPVAPSP